MSSPVCFLQQDIPHSSPFDSLNQHPLRSACLAPEPGDAGITRPYLSRLIQDAPSDSSLDTNDESSSSKKTDKADQERLVITHKVQPKDSLPGVSLRYGIPLAELRRVNQLWASDSIHLRDVLYIPIDEAARARSGPHLPASQSTLTEIVAPRQPSGSLNIPPSATIQRVPASKLSFFPPSRTSHRRRRRRSLTDSQLPRSQPATLPRSHSRTQSRLTSLLTALPIAASTRDDIAARLSFDSVSSSFDDKSGSQSDNNEENHELEDIVAACHPTRSSSEYHHHRHRHSSEVKTLRNDVYSLQQSRSMPHRKTTVSPPSSYIPLTSSLSVVRTIQMEPSPIMQIPKRTNNTLIHDRDVSRLKKGNMEGLDSRTKAYAYSSGHDFMEMEDTNKRLLR